MKAKHRNQLQQRKGTRGNFTSMTIVFFRNSQVFVFNMLKYPNPLPSFDHPQKCFSIENILVVFESIFSQIKLHMNGCCRPRAGSTEKGFSRQNIQDKIDSVRQKWGFTGGAGDGEGVTGAPAATGKTPRPKSYAGEGDDGE